MANNVLNFVELDCEKLIGERLPNLLVERRYTTKQNALHYNHFLGKITRWENFDQETWNCYTDLTEHFQKLEGHNIAVTKLGEDGDPVPLVGIRCGNEISVSGHWDEYCLRQVATVAQTLDSRSQTVLNLAVEFGSSQTAESSVKINSEVVRPEQGQPGNGQPGKGQPDIVSRKSNLPAQADKFLHCIGEVKTPWAHDIERMSREPDVGGTFRRLIGQIAGYMLDEKRKYGFLTTYEQTIFLKQEQVDEEWVLFISHVFKHTVRSIGPQSGERFFSPGDLRHKVSVRLAMLTLLWLSRTEGDYVADNRTPRWVVPQKLLERGDDEDQDTFRKRLPISVPDALTTLCDTLGPPYGETDPNFFHGIPGPQSQEGSRAPSPSRSQTSLASHAPTRRSERLVAQASDLPQALSQSFGGLRIGESSSSASPFHGTLPTGQSRQPHEQQQQRRHNAAQQQHPTPQRAPQLPQLQPQTPRSTRNFARGLFSKVKVSKKKDDHKTMTPKPRQSHGNDEDDDNPTPRPKKLSFL